MNRVMLHYDAWHGDKERVLTFPDDWDVTVVGDVVCPAMGRGSLRDALKNPIGTSRLSELAFGRRRVALLVDDITRPTPVGDILPFVLEELKAGGIQDSSITLFIAGGTHGAMDVEGVKKKLGEVQAVISVISHDCSKDLMFLGTSSRGLPMYVNQAVMECDLTIGVGSIYPHATAGFSGGSKIVMPGVCGVETIKYAHSSLKKAMCRGDVSQTEFRQEMESVAEKVGLDFIVNAVLNQKREIAGLFAGDKILAHKAGVEFAEELYRIERVEDANVIITDAYPFDGSLTFANSRGLWPIREAGEGITKVALVSCSDGLGYHELFSWPGTWRKEEGNPWETASRFGYHLLTRLVRRLKGNHRKYRDVLLLSSGLTQKQLNPVWPGAKQCTSWEELLAELQARHEGRSVKVAVYRCAPFLLPR